jgi:hypothetical protein
MTMAYSDDAAPTIAAAARTLLRSGDIDEYVAPLGVAVRDHDHAEAPTVRTWRQHSKWPRGPGLRGTC